MDVDSPASPPAAEAQEEPAIIPQEGRPSHKEPMDTDMRNVQEKSHGRKPSQFELTEQNIALEIYREKDRKGRRGYRMVQMYASVKSLQIAFQRIAALGDVYNIYRNRHGWIGRTEEEVLDVARQVMSRIPSAKTAVLSYIGLLVHETTNSFFTKSENPQYAVDFSIVQGATIKLVGDWLAMLKDATDEGIFLSTLTWCCDLASEIAEHNNGRPAMKSSRTPESQCAIFASCPSIASLIRLLDYLIEKLLNENSEKCMKILFYCSRHGTNFHWIWVHIADKFPGKVVKRIFTIGGQNFKTYADAFQAKLKERAPLNILSAMHDDYRTRFSSLAEVFNLLTRKGNVDLKGTVTKMLTESLEADVADAVTANYNIVFLFKLVTISPDTLRFLVEQNHQLITPLNLFRGMLQILSLEKDVILQSVPYPEFAKQMMNELNPDSQCVVFKAVARLALDPQALKGITAKHSQSNISTITDAAFTAMNELVEVMLANTHTSDPCPPADYATISSFANGSDLQFVIDSSLSSPNHAPQIIRYLHTVSVTFAASKAAEIVSRFILSAHETHKLHVLCAFLSTVVPFHPGLMETVYKEIFTTRDVYLAECAMDTSKTDFQRSVTFITNLRTLLEWDLTVEDASFKNNELNPRSQTGALIAGVLSMAINNCNQELQRANAQNVQLMISEVGRFLKSFIPTINKENAQPRSIVVKIRYIYKISLQLAHLLKIALLAVSKKEEHSLFCFEEFRSSIILFYSDSLNQLHVNGTTRKPGMAQLFFVSFLANCLLDNKALFGEDIDLDPWKDSSIEQLKLGDDDEKEYSYLDALQSMDTHQKISRLAHSGVIGTGAKRLHPLSVACDDQLIRTHVFLDAIRNICVTESSSNDVINTRYLANYLFEVICQDALAGDVLFQDWELEKETLGKYQIVQTYYKSFILKGLVNIVAEVQPCLWLCLPILKAMLADILSSLLSTTNRMAKVSEHIMDLADDWMLLARSGNLVPERFEFFIEFLPSITVHEAYLLFLEIWRYFQRRSVTMNAIEHAVETEKTTRGAGAALLQDNYEGDLQMCRRIIQRHIGELGWLFPVLFPMLEDGEIMQS